MPRAGRLSPRAPARAMYRVVHEQLLKMNPFILNALAVFRARNRAVSRLP
jgi:hypothetical protein